MILLKEAGMKLPISDRSSHHRRSVRKGVLGNFTKFTGKHLCQSLFFNKLQASGGSFFSDLLEHWYGFVEYAKKILSLARVSYLVNDVKSLRHQELRVGVTYY